MEFSLRNMLWHFTSSRWVIAKLIYWIIFYKLSSTYLSRSRKTGLQCYRLQRGAIKPGRCSKRNTRTHVNVIEESCTDRLKVSNLRWLSLFVSEAAEPVRRPMNANWTALAIHGSRTSVNAIFQGILCW